MGETEIVPYEVGKKYRVPTIEGHWCGVFRSWPVIGPLHEDREHIKFDREHYHIDARFLSNRQMAVGDPFNHPLTLDRVVGPVRYVLRKCHRTWPEYPAHKARFLPYLESAYAGERLKPGLACPHKGAPLQGLEVHDGCVTCPLHGLRWCVETGKLKRREWPNRKGGG